MEENIKQFKCGECGEAHHTLYSNPKGEILSECINCKSVSVITFTTPKLTVDHVSGNGTLCIF
jgi:hypothetical protein